MFNTWECRQNFTLPSQADHQTFANLSVAGPPLAALSIQTASSKKICFDDHTHHDDANLEDVEMMM